MDIKELAKKLCDESGCHHKCKEIDECVVMEEAELLINQDKSNNFDVKSNNFEGKSNNELVPKENELPFVLTNEDKVSVKGKQIEEMAFDICGVGLFCFECNGKGRCKAKKYAERAYNAGYRKQSEGEWETIPDYSRSLITYRHICSVCKTFYKDIRSQGHTYCHECGSKMKGGE